MGVGDTPEPAEPYGPPYWKYNGPEYRTVTQQSTGLTLPKRQYLALQRGGRTVEQYQKLPLSEKRRAGRGSRATANTLYKLGWHALHFKAAGRLPAHTGWHGHYWALPRDPKNPNNLARGRKETPVADFCPVYVKSGGTLWKLRRMKDEFVTVAALAFWDAYGADFSGGIEGAEPVWLSKSHSKSVLISILKSTPRIAEAMADAIEFPIYDDLIWAVRLYGSPNPVR